MPTSHKLYGTKLYGNNLRCHPFETGLADCHRNPGSLLLSEESKSAKPLFAAYPCSKPLSGPLNHLKNPKLH